MSCKIFNGRTKFEDVIILDHSQSVSLSEQLEQDDYAQLGKTNTRIRRKYCRLDASAIG